MFVTFKIDELNNRKSLNERYDEAAYIKVDSFICYLFFLQT